MMMQNKSYLDRLSDFGLDSEWLVSVDSQLVVIEEDIIDSGIDLLSLSFYDDMCVMLCILYRYGVCIPSMGWLSDGGISFEWRLEGKQGIATMSLYGDRRVICGAFVVGICRVKATYEITDILGLNCFLNMLVSVFSRGKRLT